MDWLDDSQWLWWLALALAAGVVEVATVDFVFLMVVGGSLIASISAAAGLPFALQVLIFAGATLALLMTVRPPLKAWATSNPHEVMGPNALVGRPALVLETVTAGDGRVKLGGETWTARSSRRAPDGAISTDGATLEVGSTVYVVQIDGATAVVASTPPAGGSAIGGSQ